MQEHQEHRLAYVDFRRDIDIEELLVWTYRRQRAHQVIGRGEGLAEGERAVDGVAVRQRSACGVAAVERIGLLGCRVDGGGPSADHLHEDAETVHRVVAGLPWAMNPAEVIRLAAAAERPDWMPRARPTFDVVVDKRGLPRVFREPWDAGRRYGWCAIDWRLSAARIAMARREYAAWHAALRTVQLRLGDRLIAWRVSGPAAPAAPWAQKTACTAT